MALLIVAYVSRNACPHIVYPVIAAMAAFVCYTFATVREYRQPCKDTFRILYPLVVLLLIEIAAFMATLPNFDIFQRRYLREFVFVTVFFFLMGMHLRDLDDMRRLADCLAAFFFCFSVVFSVLGIIKFFYAPPCLSDIRLNGHQACIYGSSLVTDYNFYSLFLFNGLVSASFSLFRRPKTKRQWPYMAGFVIIWTAMLMAGSRRLYITSVFILAILLSSVFIPPFYRKYFHPGQRRAFILLTALLMADWALLFGFCSHYPGHDHRISEALGFRTERLERNARSICYRFNTIIGYNLVTARPKDGKGPDKLTKTSTTLTESRRQYWECAVKTYAGYTPVQKAFGTGFNYYRHFKRANATYGHPHFQPLAILLYSGIAGLTLFMAVVVYVTILYFKYFRQLFDWAFIFLVNFMYGLFSFTDAIAASFFIFTLALPLFYHYFHRRQVLETPAG